MPRFRFCCLDKLVNKILLPMSANTETNLKIPKYLPLHIARGKWVLRPALEHMEMSKWIDIDEDLIPQLKLKERLLKESYSDVLASLPGSEAGQQELLEMLIEHLLKYFPEYYRVEGTKIENLKWGKVWDISDYKDAPIALAGQLVQEDICLLQPGEGGYTLKAALMCFPLFWRLPEKIGRPLYQIHGPVPEYPEKLKHPLDLYFENLKPDRPGTRIAWGIVPTPLLVVAWYEPKEGWEKELTPENVGDRLWLRSEYQTIRRLPKTGDIIFTVRSFMDPISSLLPEIRKNLAEVIRQMSPETRAYRVMGPFLEPLLTYLDR
ncbi:DUF3445 domain-containing protein [Aerosakkonema sp. BLCC-F183]